MRASLTFFQSYNGTLMGDGCNLPHYIPDVFLMSIILFMGTFLLSIELKDFKNALFFPSKVCFLSFATRQRLYTFATYVCVLFAFLILLILYKCTKNPILYKIHKIQSSIYTYSRIQTRNEILFVI